MDTNYHTKSPTRMTNQIQVTHQTPVIQHRVDFDVSDITYTTQYNCETPPQSPRPKITECPPAPIINNFFTQNSLSRKRIFPEAPKFNINTISNEEKTEHKHSKKNTFRKKQPLTTIPPHASHRSTTETDNEACETSSEK